MKLREHQVFLDTGFYITILSSNDELMDKVNGFHFNVTVYVTALVLTDDGVKLRTNDIMGSNYKSHEEAYKAFRYLIQREKIKKLK